GRLARAVRTEEAEHAMLHREREVVQCNDLRVTLRHVFEPDRAGRDGHLAHGVRDSESLALVERTDHLEHHAVLLPDDRARDPGVVADEESLDTLDRHRVRHSELRGHRYRKRARWIADRADRGGELW